MSPFRRFRFGATDGAGAAEQRGLLRQHPDRNSTDTARVLPRVHLFHRLSRARGAPPQRAPPADRPAPAAADRCRLFADSGSGRPMAREPLSNGVCFASTPIATALTLLAFSPAFTSFIGYRARGARRHSELRLQTAPHRRRPTDVAFSPIPVRGDRWRGSR